MQKGWVALVGAGPGDAELITVRGLRRLREADVVVYDRLIASGLLQEAPDEAERVFAGKAARFAAMDQRAIETLLIDRARRGKRVVRLKGGDPFVFGRGGEEIQALAAAGVPYEVIPGITSAVAVPAAAGIPVTHRELSSQVTIVAGYEDPEKEESAVDWEWLAQSTGTLVILMGLERLEAITVRLIAEGMDPSTPAAVISRGTCPDQVAVTAPLGELAAAVTTARLSSPSIIVVGEVARFAETLGDQLAALPCAV